jgi:hypothetical protein
LSDSLFGRYYRYLAPGNYTFEITAPGYRPVIKEITISSDSLTHWDIRLERGAMLNVEDVVITDNNSGNTGGNGDGLINLGETIGISFSLANIHPVESTAAFAKISSGNPYLTILSDSLFFGDIAGNTSMAARDTALFRIDPRCPDGEKPEITIAIGDSGGFGWLESVFVEVYAPVTEMGHITINDSAGNGNGAFDNGESVTIGIPVTNNGRQGIREISARLKTNDVFFKVTADQDTADQLAIGETHTFYFTAFLSADAPKVQIADFNFEMISLEGYVKSFDFQLTNIHGFYDDFENGVNGWTHATYGITPNDHDDWQLGIPAGKAGDPDSAASADNCWGTDLGWDDYQARAGTAPIRAMFTITFAVLPWIARACRKSDCSSCDG